MNKSVGKILAAGLAAAIVMLGSMGAAHAAAYVGKWDPTYGSPFTNLGWRGIANFFVPDSCEPSGTALINNSPACGGAAAVTSAQVEFYDVNAVGQPTISTLLFNPASMIVFQLSYVAGDLSQLTTSQSNFVDPVEDLSAFAVSFNTEFSLFFTLDGPRLAWRECSFNGGDFAIYSEEPACKSGLNDFQQFPASFRITRVPEPGTLALVCLALLALTPRRVRSVLTRRF